MFKDSLSTQLARMRPAVEALSPKIVPAPPYGGRTSLLFGCLLFLVAACQPATSPQWQWVRAEAGLPRQSISLAVAAHPTDVNRLWLGAYTPAGLARSEDGGRTWISEVVGRADNPIFDLLLTPPQGENVETLLWAATRAGLLQSADGGSSWQPVSNGLPAMPVLALAADAAGRVYAGMDTAGIYAQSPAGGWEALASSGSPAAGGGGLSLALTAPGGAQELLASAGVLSLAVSADGQQLYAGTAGRGLFASQDGGRTWSNAFAGAYGSNLALNPLEPQVAVASLRDQLLRTQDGGKSWQVLPVDWAQALVVSLSWQADGTLAAGTGQGQLYYSTNAGDSWLESSAGLPAGMGVLDLAANPQQVLAATWSGLYGSQDSGQSWHYLSPALGQPQAASLLTTPTGLWLGTRAGLFRWQADSQQWVAAAGQFPAGGIISLAADPSQPQILYAGTGGDGLYRSPDNGTSWQRLPTLGVGVPAISVDPQNSDRVYMLASWERVYETRDGGRLWQARWTGMSVTTEAVSLAVDPQQAYVYVGSDAGLYRSYDGQFWRLVAPALTDQTILALLAQPAPADAGGGSVLYLGTTRGVYRSLDRGGTVQGGDQVWGQGLENISVTALLAHPRYPSRLYAGTAYQGIYQSVDWGYTWQSIGPAELNQAVVEEMAWGPAGELFAVAANGVWAGTVK